MKITHKKFVSLVTTSITAFALVATSASAQTAVSTVRGIPAKMQARVTGAADIQISHRISSLQNLITRVTDMKHLSDTEKSAIASSAQVEMANLTSLETRITSDTSTTSLRADAQSIAKSYRVYVLVEPQMRILSTADRINTLVSMMTIVEAKINARITSLKNNGADTSAMEAAMTDVSVKIADAQTQAATAVGGTTTLVPDNGDTTIAASNKTALENARAALKAATTDLQAIRKDFGSVIDAIKQLSPKAASATTTATTTQ